MYTACREPKKGPARKERDPWRSCWRRISPWKREPMKRRASVACYEVELNLVIHSDGGTLTLQMEPDRVTLISRDVGPGIPDIEKAMSEGFSTANEEARTLGFGAGMGLPNMKRNATDFDIQSEMGKGTTITMSFALT